MTFALLLQYCATLGMFLTLHINFRTSLLMPRILVSLLEELHLGRSNILTFVYFPTHHHRLAPPPPLFSSFLVIFDQFPFRSSFTFFLYLHACIFSLSVYARTLRLPVEEVDECPELEFEVLMQLSDWC